MSILAAAGVMVALASEFQRAGEVELPKAVEVRNAASIPSDIPVVWRGTVGGASVALHAGLKDESDEDRASFRPQIAIEIASSGRTSRFTIDRGDFRSVCPGRKKAEPRIDVT